MTVEKHVDGDCLTIAVDGAIDTVTAPELQREISLDGVKNLVFDISKVGYISSAGLRIFLNCQKSMLKTGGKMAVSGANESVMHVFAITGFTKIIHFV